MAESHALMEYRKELDEGIQSVMPDTWPGHARIAAFKKTDHLSDDMRETAIKASEKLFKQKDLPAEKIAQAVVRKVEERAS